MDSSEKTMKQECFVNTLSRLRESSKTAVVSANFSDPYTMYMHVNRPVQEKFVSVLKNTYNTNHSELILLCGSVGDGKSHMLSYCKQTYPEMMESFYVHNDSTASLYIDKPASYTLMKIMDAFTDKNIETSNSKVILAINLGTLSNFLEADTENNFLLLKEYIDRAGILDDKQEKQDDDRYFHCVNFADYHLYELSSKGISSQYIKGIFSKIVQQKSDNIFYKHYLYGYDMDATENLLKQMIAYGESVVCLYENIDKNEYYFEDLCLDAKNYKATKDHKILKAMFKDILSLDAQYCKLPVMYMVSVLSANSALVNEMQFDTFKRIITNLYVYAVLFALSSNKKSKQVIDYTIRNALNGDGDVLINTLKKAKELRESRIDEFTLPSKCSNFEMLACIYSIMDNYVSSDNWITRKYDRDDDVNLEHFVMPDNDSYVVNWIRENEERTIIPIPIRKTLAKEYKKYTVNYLLIDEKLNRLLRNYDIVEKIKLIKEWFRVVNDYSCLPKHIRIFIEYIEKMDLYQELVEMKSEDESDKEIFGRKYFEFLDEFFSEQNQSSLLVVLKKGFETTFHN